MGKMLDVKGRNKKVHKSILPYLLLSMCISILFFIPAVHAGPVGITILTEDGGRVDWSHKHNLIAFDRMGSDGYFDIWVMKPDGSEERMLVRDYDVEAPTWAPNGRVLAFFRQSRADDRGLYTAKVYTIDLTGYNEREVSTPIDASDPAWSPLIP